MNLPKNKNILFFCAHPDDDTFSAGATIHTLVKNKNNVVSAYLTSSPRGVTRNIPIEEKINIRKIEAARACKILGSRPIFLNLGSPTLRCNPKNVETVVKLLKEERPEMVFLPPKNDAHPTHKTATRIVLKAIRSAKTEELWFYETWTPLEKPNFIFFFDENLLKIKIKAMKQHQSQLERLDFLAATVALNTFRGIMGQELLGGFGKSYNKGAVYGEAFLRLADS